MKFKKINLTLFSALISAFLLLSSCGDIPDSGNENVNQTIEEEASTNNDTAKPEEATEPEEQEEITYAEMETAYKLGDWEVTVNSIEFKDKISENDFISFNADEGNLYALINITATNKGKEAGSFQESFSIGDYVSVKLLYDNDYEYEPTILLGYSNSFDNISIPALSSKTAEIIIEVPELINNEKEKAEIVFTYSKDKIVYKLL